MDTETNIDNTEPSVKWLVDYFSGKHKSILVENAGVPSAVCVDLVLSGADLDQVRNVLAAFGDIEMPVRISKYRGIPYITFGLNIGSRLDVETDSTRASDIEYVIDNDRYDWKNSITIGENGVTPKDALENSLVSGAVFDMSEGILYIVGTNYTKTCKGFPLLGQINYSSMHVKYAVKGDGSDLECLKEIFSNFSRKIPLVYFPQAAKCDDSIPQTKRDDRTEITAHSR